MDFGFGDFNLDMAQIFASMPAADRAKFIAKLPPELASKLSANASYDELYSFYNSLSPELIEQVYSSFTPEDYTRALPATTVTAEPVAASDPYAGLPAADTSYVPGFTPALEAPRDEGLAGEARRGPLSAMDETVAGMQRINSAPTNYGQKPVSGLDPLALQLQDVDGQKGFHFVTNKGAVAGFVPAQEGATYQLWNERGKNKVWASGTGEEGLRKVYAAAQDLSARDGKGANWGVKVLLPGQTEWQRVVEDDPGKGFGGVLNVLGDVALGALAGVATGGLALGPALAGAALGGGLKAAGANVTDIALPVIGAATGLGPVLGAGLGSFGSSVVQGRPIEDALLRGAISAGTAGLMDVSGLGDKIGGALGSVAKDLGIQAGPALIPGFTGGIGGVAGGAIPQAVGGEILVPGAVSSIPAAVTSGALGGLTSGAIAGAIPPVGTETVDPNDIVVAKRNPVPAVGSPSIVPPLGNLGIDPTTQAAIDKAAEQPAAKEKSDLDKVSDYLRLAGLATGLLGGVAGGGGGNSPALVPGGLTGGGMPGSFNRPLPSANLPGLAAGASTPRTAADLAGQGLATPQDWYRYGYGPEQSFQQGIPVAPRNTSTAYTGYAEGGFAVGGPGDGRDDKIPAMLSDGEYVIDAETVAMLGNGSTKAGADALDAFRVSIRKHKGRKMAKGDFSANAKKPEQYLKKGRS